MADTGEAFKLIVRIPRRKWVIPGTSRKDLPLQQSLSSPLLHLKPPIATPEHAKCLQCLFILRPAIVSDRCGHRLPSRPASRNSHHFVCVSPLTILATLVVTLTCAARNPLFVTRLSDSLQPYAQLCITTALLTEWLEACARNHPEAHQADADCGPVMGILY